jgi:hypothetical protein
MEGDGVSIFLEMMNGPGMNGTLRRGCSEDVWRELSMFIWYFFYVFVIHGWMEGRQFW